MDNYADGNTAPRQAAAQHQWAGLSYMHSGMYGMYALQESVRQMPASRGAIRAENLGRHGVGGMFAASGTIIFTNENENFVRDAPLFLLLPLAGRRSG